MAASGMLEDPWMATLDECRSAIEELVERVAAAETDPRHRSKVPNRTIGVTLLDLDVTYVGDIKNGELVDIREEAGDFKPQVRVVCSSDDLISLTNGEMNFAHAWATGQIRLDASFRDLLRLRSLG